MAELLSSSDEESLVDDKKSPIRKPPPIITSITQPHTSKSREITRFTSPKWTAKRQVEPEEELMESMFSPSKRTPPKQRRSTDDEELFPFTPSPTHTEESSQMSSQAEEDKKPVISAKALLMKYFPQKTDATTLGASATQSTVGKRTQDGGRSTEVSGWRKRLKSTEESLSQSERIARKYGLLPSGATTTATSSSHSSSTVSTSTTTPFRDAARRSSHSPSSQSSLEPSPVNKKQAVWNSQMRQVAEKEDVEYVSPFSKRASGNSSSVFRDMRRRQEPAVDKETFYTDDAKQSTPVNRPRHVIASKLATASDEDGGGWLSDAKDLDSDDDEVASAFKSRGSTSVAQRSGRKRTRPTTTHSNDSDGDEDLDVNQWPMLPPPSGGDCGPLKLESPTDEQSDIEVCANINSYLFDYQREGVQFLFNAYMKHTGAILGDEMGLGKTIQVIALLSAILGKHGDHRDKDSWQAVRKSRRRLSGVTASDDNNNAPSALDDDYANPILIVVPASLLHNWESELRVWMSCATVIVIGKPQEREQILEQAARGDYEIVICSYDVLKITLDKVKLIPWELIVFDEMHCLKNPDSQLTQAVKAIKCRRKLGLTGTLMQNNEKELHCLIDTIAPGVLGTWNEFRAYYGDDIKYGRKKSAVPEAVERSRKKEKKLRQVLVPYYLRREKEINPSFQEVKKCDQVVFCDLTPYQLAAYKRILAMPEFELLRQGEDPCDCGRESARKRKECCYTTPAALGLDGQRALLWERFHPSGEPCNACPNCMGLVCVAQLLKLSNHMELLKVNPRDPPNLQRYQADFAATALGEDLEAVGGVQQVSTFQEMRAIGTQTCGKMLVLEKLLALWKRKKQKTLLFSRSTRMLDILQLFLISKAVTYLRLDGQTKVDERLQLVNKFNDPESNISVFLISTRAGGLGLNLPTATNVVIFDPSWNPAHDCQAQDRAYRIGQTKDVQVYRLITLGTIEEMIYVRQIYKQQLSDTTLKGVKAPRYFEGVQGDRRQQGELFGIRNLLCWKEGGVLKDIQDAYKRDRDDLVIQVNQVDYDAPASARKKTRKSKVDDEGDMALVDKEMVEVADEMVGGILNESLNGDTTTQETTGQDGSDDDDDIDLSAIQGARTLMHDNIVGEEEGTEHHGGGPFSETDEEDEEMPVVSTNRQADQSLGQRLDHGVLPVVAPPSASAPTPAAAHPSNTTPPRKSLYIPQYL